MKILVLSDSHSMLQFMRRCVQAVRPDAIVHLGDYYEDGQALAQEYPHLVVHQVPGNCDLHRCPLNTPGILCYPVGGVPLYMTHGHIHHVKMGTAALIRDAKAAGAQAALYGHTHRPECRLREDGMWVMNPGTCGGFGGTCGVMEISGGSITDCRILNEKDLEALL